MQITAFPSSRNAHIIAETAVPFGKRLRNTCDSRPRRCPADNGFKPAKPGLDTDLENGRTIENRLRPNRFPSRNGSQQHETLQPNSAGCLPPNPAMTNNIERLPQPDQFIAAVAGVQYHKVLPMMSR